MLWLVLCLIIAYIAAVTMLRSVAFRCRHKNLRVIERHAGVTKGLCIDCGHVILKPYAKWIEKASDYDAGGRA